MGEKRRRLDAFRARYQSCAYCESPIDGVEHCPARILFPGKRRLSGWEFPACKQCNNGTSHADQLFALFVFSQILAPTPEEDDHIQKLVSALGNNHPRIVREFQVQFAPGGLIAMPPSMAGYIQTVCDKLVMSAHFLNSGGERLPRSSQICHWHLTNHYILNHGYPHEVLGLLPSFDTLIQGGKSAENHFRYRIGRGDGFLLAEFHFMSRVAIISAAFLSQKARDFASETGFRTHTSALLRPNTLVSPAGA